MMTVPEDIIRYWFEEITDRDAFNKNKSPFSKWFSGGKRIDEEISQRFAEDLRKAKRGAYDSWQQTPRGCLALIILFDQFSRNIYRHTPEMYAADTRAFDLAMRMLQDGTVEELELIHRVFVCMPLMHTEDLAAQLRSVEEFTRIVELSRLKCPQNTSYFEYNLKYAYQHKDDIFRFGRFPYRNAVLGRPSTAEEIQFLTK